jgi:hypothetical protein
MCMVSNMGICTNVATWVCTEEAVCFMAWNSFNHTTVCQLTHIMHKHTHTQAYNVRLRGKESVARNATDTQQISENRCLLPTH